MTADQRLLLVHAHPDDESIGQGATMARYVAEGRGVTLVTCTAGEMGEILVPELEHLAADPIHDNAFWHADLTEAADHLVRVIREVQPQVMVTYDQFGGYGHPDHIQAHRVATYATALAAVPTFRPELGEAWDVAKVYWGA